MGAPGVERGIVLERVRLVEQVDVGEPIGLRQPDVRLGQGDAEPEGDQVGADAQGHADQFVGGGRGRDRSWIVPRTSMASAWSGRDVQQPAQGPLGVPVALPRRRRTPTSAASSWFLTWLTSASVIVSFFSSARVLLQDVGRAPRRWSARSGASRGRRGRRRRPCRGCRSRCGRRPGIAPPAPAWPGRRRPSAPAACG